MKKLLMSALISLPLLCSAEKVIAGDQVTCRYHCDAIGTFKLGQYKFDLIAADGKLYIMKEGTVWNSLSISRGPDKERENKRVLTMNDPNCYEFLTSAGHKVTRKVIGRGDRFNPEVTICKVTVEVNMLQSGY